MGILRDKLEILTDYGLDYISIPDLVKLKTELPADTQFDLDDMNLVMNTYFVDGLEHIFWTIKKFNAAAVLVSSSDIVKEIMSIEDQDELQRKFEDVTYGGGAIHDIKEKLLEILYYSNNQDYQACLDAAGTTVEEMYNSESMIIPFDRLVDSGLYYNLIKDIISGGLKQ